MPDQEFFISPYGDRPADGYIQLSFTLPVAEKQARSAALEICSRMSLKEIDIAHLQRLSDNLTYIQIFAKLSFNIKYRPVVETDTPLSHDQLLQLTIDWEQPLTVVGACTGNDAHTVGLDAILNKKGYKGHKGLESYQCFKVINLGSQINNRTLIDELQSRKADVLLVSQIITQQNHHLHNLTNLIDMLEAFELREKMICVIGGPRISQELALELGFDAGFGLGTLPADVASFIVKSFNNNGRR